MFVCMAPPMALSCFRETWEFGPFACEMYAFCGSLFGCASIYTMMMIAFDSKVSNMNLLTINSPSSLISH